MVENILAVVFVVLLIPFFLSVFGPMHSQSRFWGAIYRIRGIMDLCTYWFFNLCAVATILYVVYMAVRGLI